VSQSGFSFANKEFFMSNLMKITRVPRYCTIGFAWLCTLLLAACGGGASGGAESPVLQTVTDADRMAAAIATVNHNAKCDVATMGPFYWEIGDRTGMKASGTVGVGAPLASTVMSIASASKWVYAAYVVQKVGVRDGDVPFLNFTSGYSLFGLPSCRPNDTVGSCLAGNDFQSPQTIGKFYYDGGHMQHHAVYGMNLGDATKTALASEISATIGDIGSYSQAQLAGSIRTSAGVYAAFLQRILKGELAIGAVLGSHKVCTNPATCASAVSSPIPGEDWSYSLGHWVEDDPVRGDHAFSSAGAFGFYPWIDSSKALYGIVARSSTEANAGYHSAQCGRLIRQAWAKAAQVTLTTPTP